MTITFGREICSDLAIAQQREWLVTNGIGGYASGTVAGLPTRSYHGLLVAALKPPLDRTLLVTHLDEQVDYGKLSLPLSTTRWVDGTVAPRGYEQIEQFGLEGTIPVWQFAIADARLEKRIWMEPGANTTLISYRFERGSLPLQLTVKGLVNYRGYHSRTQAGDWRMDVQPVDRGLKVTAFPEATPFYLFATWGKWAIAPEWYRDFELAVEAERGLDDRDDNLRVGSLTVTLNPGETLCLIASTEASPDLDAAASLQRYQDRTQAKLQQWQAANPTLADQAPDWVRQLVLAADQFIVDRPLPNHPQGKSILAGYHWFADWGRDTMISLPGLTLATGWPDLAREILLTFAQFVSQGMLPNRFPDDGNPLTDADYNTVDATLWYVEAVRQYLDCSGDKTLLAEIFPVLQNIIGWHQRGTRFNIHLDPQDGLLTAGAAGVQLTWMDAKVGDWVVTPRIGKPVEINALWYAALRSLAHFARCLGQPSTDYDQLAEATLQGFQRFWQADRGYCFDVLDSPTGSDASLRPNQLLAISLGCDRDQPALLTPDQQQQVVTLCGQQLLTSFGLRSLDPRHPQYQGHYGGDQTQRDAAYHQGTVWARLLGSFAIAHYAAFGDRALAAQVLQPIAHHLQTAGLGTISEIFDGDAPFLPRGCIAQAWSVGEILRAWTVIHQTAVSPDPAAIALT
ncbi:glycogen debranching enzyme-related protein [Synechococcus elongatus PCC 6301]|uniref:Glycogen debranching enzyme-related protein n=1 Tax=Synechococcus sp. (strain ATCC 27144 / PCC 6301 / SAUG 1402/1) TaxID=269084 RepID=A0A0H3JYU2_SYNP6|nr:amylo-alpha-1,6-glucosidase [Synechococcus elongatus]BAD78222.1 glycogen debranching enzyme-related protein [Synechococcus elongatus PCC 6301]